MTTINNALFMDSFDHYTTYDDILHKWSFASGTVSIVAGGGRYPGSNSMQLIGIFSGTFLRRNLPSAVYGELTVGFAFTTSNLPGSGTSPIFEFYDNGFGQISVQIDSLGRIGVYLGSTLLGASQPLTVVANIYNHVMFNVKFATDTTGHFSLKFNSIEVAAGTNIMTSTSGNANQVALACGPVTDFDDFWVIDPTTTDPSLYGDKFVIYSGSNGVGGTTEWTSSTVNPNYQNVSDLTPDGDTSYNSAASAGLVDLYNTTNLPANVTGVVNIQTVLNLRKDDANPASFAPVLGDGAGGTTDGTSVSLGQTYGFQLENFGTNPNAANAPWTPTTANALQVGPKRTV